MSTPRVLSVTALAASLLVIVFTITHAAGFTADPAAKTEIAFCSEGFSPQCEIDLVQDAFIQVKASVQ
jgi:hypothetical protein